MTEFLENLASPADALDSLSSTAVQLASGLTMSLGAVGLIWASVLLIQKLMAGPSGNYHSWAKIVLMVATGGLLLTGPSIITVITGTMEPESGADSTAGGDEPEPNPPAGPPESPEPAEPADPISLPKIENADTIFIVLGIAIGVLIIAAALWWFLRSAHKARQTSKIEKERVARIDVRWQGFIDRAIEIKRKIYNAETDWDMLFSYPALTDVTVGATADLYRAQRKVDDLDSTRPSDIDESSELSTLVYPRAVQELEAAWKKAFNTARRIGMDAIPEDERRKVESIRRLLAMATSPGSTDAERQTAYDRAQKLIKELRSIHVPQHALLELEEGRRLMIEASAAPADGDIDLTAVPDRRSKRRARVSS